MSELKISSKVKLNNGVEMPIFGLGKLFKRYFRKNIVESAGNFR